MSKNLLATTNLVSNDIVKEIDELIEKGYKITLVYIGDNYTDEQVYYYYNCIFAHHIRNNCLKIICCDEMMTI